jgi:hypothetical protein
MEIVYKIAPDADLTFATGDNGGSIQMAQNIRDLAEISKCRIIVDDISFDNDGPFQDGPLGRAVNDVTAAGVLFISAAGNTGSKTHLTSGTWEGDFADGGADSAFGTGQLHQFDQGKTFATLTKQARKVALYWSDPWFDSTNKYSLYIDIVRKQRRVSLTNAFFPWQFFDASKVLVGGMPLDCPGHPGVSCLDVGDKIRVKKEDGSNALALHLDTFRGAIDVGTNGSTYGHSATDNALTVAAVPVPTSPTRAFTGGSNVKVDNQSSDGRRRMFFKPDNTAITPGNFLFATNGGRLLDKPDLAAATDVKTTLPPGTLSQPTGLNPFEGTSAAAPHVAAIAALILSYRPNLTPAQVRQILIASALDIEKAGWDEVSGHGIPMADKALMLAGSMQFAPKLALKMAGNPQAPKAPIILRADRSVAGWPGNVKANAIDNLIVVTSEGGLLRLNDNGTGAETWLPSGSNVVGVSEELGFAFKSDGSAQPYDAPLYNGLSLPIPDATPLVNAVAGAGELVSNRYYFLKRDGTVERWTLSASQPPNNFSKSSTLQTRDVVDLKSMHLGSLPLAMLLRDGTVVTVDRNGNPTDAITYGNWTTVPRPAAVNDVVAIATGYAHVLALKRDGKVLAWGANQEGQSNVPSTLSDVVSITAAGNMSYALKKSGEVVSWGSSRAR